MASGMSIGWLLENRAQRFADETFLIWEPFEGPAQSWTYARFTHQVAQVAAGLQKRGVGHGDFVLIHLENSPEFLLTWFACAWLGAVAVST
nr:acyl--CoA ligase [Pseudomonas sp.]